jgi:hypothetical protein
LIKKIVVVCAHAKPTTKSGTSYEQKKTPQRPDARPPINALCAENGLDRTLFRRLSQPPVIRVRRGVAAPATA